MTRFRERGRAHDATIVSRRGTVAELASKANSQPRHCGFRPPTAIASITNASQPLVSFVAGGRQMLVRDYDAFIKETDLNKKRSRETREDIALYGVVGEMGALANAVKRRLIAEQSGVPWNLATDEIVEKLGDTLWYWGSLCQLYADDIDQILRLDIRTLQYQLRATSARGQIFRNAVGPTRVSDFHQKSQVLLAQEDINLDDYRSIAFLTRRTDGRIFVGVCLAVLAQLGAELLRLKFPDVEDQINLVVRRREVPEILSEILWHVSALSSVYQLTLEEILKSNQKKINDRLDKSSPTPSHCDRYPRHEHFPRKMEISFIRVGQDRARMYLNGRKLGDELTDNAYNNDGYRFHDVLHLAVLAHLGWSPVLRALLKKKRKSTPRTDEVEDGARAIIVEEAIIKAIHSEGERVSAPRAKLAGGDPVPLFASHGDITFQFLGFIKGLAKGLEVENNQSWEWERAMLQASEVFCELRKEMQGTVTIDLDARRISFDPLVYIDGAGAVCGMGSVSVDASLYSPAARPHRSDLEWCGEKDRLYRATESDIAAQLATKQAILRALNLPLEQSSYDAIEIKAFGHGVSVKATGPVEEAMWAQKVISFRTTNSLEGSFVRCTALAIADPKDTSR
jgi:NTP pyrophosphatase (non-canonical NTP hydrolase)